MYPTQPPSTPNGRFQELIARHPRPGTPALQAWEMSASSVITPFLPARLRIPAFLVDRLGRIHLSPEGLAIDQKKVILWKDIQQIHTRPAFDVVTTSMIDKAVQRAAFMLPPIPGVRMGAELVAHKAAEALVSILQVALSGSAPSLLFDIPITVTYSSWGRRTQEMTPGLLSTAFLALPGVSDGLLATAVAQGTPIIRHSSNSSQEADRVAQLLGDYVRGAAARLRKQPPPEPSLIEDHTSPSTTHRPPVADPSPGVPPALPASTRRIRREYSG